MLCISVFPSTRSMLDTFNEIRARVKMNKNVERPLAVGAVALWAVQVKVCTVSVAVVLKRPRKSLGMRFCRALDL